MIAKGEASVGMTYSKPSDALDNTAKATAELYRIAVKKLILLQP